MGRFDFMGPNKNSIIEISSWPVCHFAMFFNPLGNFYSSIFALDIAIVHINMRRIWNSVEIYDQTFF